MAIGAITMILTNVGLQIYNNWCGSRQNDKLQKKREEFERAARERNTEHMWRLLREGQELTMQLEAEKHQQRLDELKNEVDNLLTKLTYETAIANWPLKVLPIVMKNQAFGNLLANQEENVAMHVIFSRSNYDEFNKLVFPIVEKELELYCNNHWSTKSDHPVLFYSGAWKKEVNNPSDIQVESMKTALGNLPTLLITPFFRPNDGRLVFQVYLWGVYASTTDKYEFQEIEPKCDEFHFQNTYTNKDDYEGTMGLLDNIVEDLVPYLQCMIGYMADTYFWSSAGLAPHLPKLLNNGTIYTDGMKYLVSDSREYYNKILLTSKEKAKENPFDQERLLNLYNGSAVFWDDRTKESELESIFWAYISKRNLIDARTLDVVLDSDVFTIYDLPFIKAFLSCMTNKSHYKKLDSAIRFLESIDYNYSVLLLSNKEKLEALAEENGAEALYRLGELYEYSIGVNWNDSLSEAYYRKSAEQGFPLASIKLNNGNITDNELDILSKLRNVSVIQATDLLFDFWMKKKQYNMILMEGLINTRHPGVLYKYSCALLKEGTRNDYAEKLLRKTADLGYVCAIELFLKISKERNLFKDDPTQFFAYAQKGMIQKSPYATYCVSMCFLEGYGVAQSTNTALDYLKEAIKLESNEAIELNNVLSNYQKL